MLRTVWNILFSETAQWDLSNVLEYIIQKNNNFFAYVSIKIGKNDLFLTIRAIIQEPKVVRETFIPGHPNFKQ